jgi:hypothetical protein
MENGLFSFAGNRLSGVIDSDAQDKINIVGCHGNTFGSDVKNNLNKITSPNKPIIKALEASCKKHPSGPQNIANIAANRCESSPQKMGPSHKSDGNGYIGTHSSLPGWENVPIGMQRKPPRPPRTDSLRKAPINNSSMSNVESQYGSTTEIGDDASSSTSGSYVVDHEVLTLDNYSPCPAFTGNVTIQSSNV